MFTVMGVSRLFPRGGQKFSMGAKTYFLPKRNKKETIFFQKNLKTYIFWPALARQGGRG
jgi:hypothetical protein